ncbi:MAG: hypothetical protein AB1Z23_01485 [Eubacteriales bacterium]
MVLILTVLGIYLIIYKKTRLAGLCILGYSIFYDISNILVLPNAIITSLEIVALVFSSVGLFYLSRYKEND